MTPEEIIAELESEYTIIKGLIEIVRWYICGDEHQRRRDEGTMCLDENSIIGSMCMRKWAQSDDKTFFLSDTHVAILKLQYAEELRDYEAKYQQWLSELEPTCENCYFDIYSISINGYSVPPHSCQHYCKSHSLFLPPTRDSFRFRKYLRGVRTHST